MIGHNGVMQRRPLAATVRRGCRRVSAILTVTAAVALPACSGDDAAPSTSAAVTSSAPVTTTASSTPESTTRSTALPSTEPSDSAATTGPAPTTAATTTAPSTSAPSDMSEDAVRAAVTQLHTAWTECARQLPNCDAVGVSTGFATGELSDALFVQASASNQDGRRAENVDSRTLTIESVQLDPAAGTAAVVTCESDGTIIYGPDGSLINDKYVSRRIAYTFLWNGQNWLGSTRVEQERAEGEGNGLCGPAA